MTKNSPGVISRYRAVLTVILSPLVSARVFACPICFGVEEGPVTHGLRTAVLVLVGVTLAVLAGFGVFIAKFVRRSREAGGPTPGSERAETVEKTPVPLCQ